MSNAFYSLTLFIDTLYNIYTQLFKTHYGLHVLQKVSVALYDYTAADDDEISFVEGDNIIQCDPIDEGWMNGTVERTGETGMLPSNYVEPQGW